MTEALEQQTATSEILRVIASSPTDSSRSSTRSPRAPRGCARRTIGAIFRFDGERLRLVARHGIAAPAHGESASTIPRPAADTVGGRAVLRPADDPHRGHRGSRGRVPGRSVAAARRLGLPDHAGGAAAARGRADRRRSSSSRTRGPAVLGQADRAPRDLRRPGGHRHRERAAVHGAGGAEPRADRGARAADGDERDPAGHRELADRPPAGLRRRRRERRAAVRGDGCVDLPPRRGASATRGACMERCAEHWRSATTVPGHAAATVGGRAVLDRRTIHVEDILAAEAEFPRP